MKFDLKSKYYYSLLSKYFIKKIIYFTESKIPTLFINILDLKNLNFLGNFFEIIIVH